jgi:phosphocarrier protein FPr
LIDLVVRAARSRGLHVAVCGESAADPEMIALLIGLGVDELSVAPGSVAAVSARTRTLDAAACRNLAATALDAVTVAEVRALVRREA